MPTVNCINCKSLVQGREKCIDFRGEKQFCLYHKDEETEEWLRQNPKVDNLIFDIDEHMEKSSFDCNGFNSEKFRILCGKSIRKFLEEANA